MSEIVAYLEDKDKRFILDEYLAYHGHGLYASDIKYLLIEQLQIEDLKEVEDFE